MSSKKPERRRHYEHAVFDSARWDGFDSRADDITVCTSYKAGTTWTQTICALLIFQQPELAAPLSQLSPWLDMVLKPVDEVHSALAAQRHRRIIKTHTPLDGLPWSDDPAYVFCGRDPRDVFMSMLNHLDNTDEEVMRRLRSEAGLDAPETDMPERPSDPNILFRVWLEVGSFEWEQDGFPFWSHFSHANSFWEHRHLPNLYFLHYADLQADLDGEMRRLSEFLGIDVDESRWPSLVQAATFDAVKARPEQFAPEADIGIWKDNAKFFNKGTSGQWRGALSAESLALYEKVKAERMSAQLGDWLERGSAACGDTPKNLPD